MSRCLVVFYHYVRDPAETEFPDIKALTPDQFEAQLDWLQQRYTMVDYPTFEASLRGEWRSNRPCALLTFDDGLIDHYQAVLPALTRRGLSGVFFVVGATLDATPRVLNVHRAHFLLARLGPEGFADEVRRGLVDLPEATACELPESGGLYRYDGFDAQDVKRLLNYELPAATADALLSDLFCRHIGDEAAFAQELYLTPDLVAEMASEGMTFGFHTERHVPLSRLSRPLQWAEVQRGVAAITGLTGQRSTPFCYPYGHAQTYDRDSVAVVEKAGYSTAFTAVREMVRFEESSRYELPRIDTRDLPPVAQERNVA